MSSTTEDIKKTLAKKLIDSLSLKETREDEFFEAMERLFSSIIDDKEELEILIKAYKETYCFDVILNKMTDIYATNFTEDEMIDMINFFNTPTGKVWVKKHPSIIREIMDVSEAYGASIADEIIRKIDKE